MGIINVTPDSFSDGGSFYVHEKAIAHGLTLLKEGAHILDIGGESTRPYAKAVSTEEELRRVLPVVKELSQHGLVSIDTRKAKVMEKALNAGAQMVNDISGLKYDKSSFDVVKSARCKVILTHSQGEPFNMQDNPTYSNLKEEIFDYLIHRRNSCIEAGMKSQDVYVDPGLGFGKLKEHNFWILDNLHSLSSLSPVVLGASRKSFLGEEGDTATDRLPQSLAACAVGANKKIKIIRVHDVAETRRFLKIYQGFLPDSTQKGVPSGQEQPLST